MDALDIIPLDSAKNWLNIELAYTDEDATISRLIKAAIAWVETYTCWRTYQRIEVLYNRQDNYYNTSDYFPDYGTGFYNGPSGVRWTPKGMSIYLYPFTVTSVKDKDDNAVEYTAQNNPLKTLLYAAPNSIITLQTGFVAGNIGQIPPPLIEAAYKWITYLYENRDTYQASQFTDGQILINQYRRAVI